MQTSVLQEFLSLRLLNIGADDSRLDKLVGASQELAQHYAKSPKDALASLLAAWDPAADAHASLLDIDKILEKHWPTFRGAFQDEPVTLFRTIILEAVMQAIELQGTLAIAVYSVGANVLPHFQVGREQQIISKIFGRARTIASERVARTWPPFLQSSSCAMHY